MAPKRSRMLALDGLSEDRTHYEGAKRRGESHRHGQRHHAEAEADADDQQDFVVDILAGPLEDARNYVNTDQEPENQEKGQLGQVEEHLLACETVGDRHRGEEDHQENGYQVFYDQRTEYHPGERILLEAHVVVGLEHHHRGGHREQTSQEDTFHGAPAHGLSREIAQHENPEEFGSSCQQGAAAHFEQLLETELQSETEHQKDDADLRPLVDGFFTRDAREEGDVRTDQEAGDNIAQDQGLLQRLRDDGKEAGGDQNHRQIPHKVQFFTHSVSCV